MKTTLFDMLSYCRPAGSITENLFIDRYIKPIPGIYQDKWCNWHVVVGESVVLWSCHTDTVHASEGRQTTHYDPITGIVQLSRKSRARSSFQFGKVGKQRSFFSDNTKSSCLGADDTAGVWLCTEMIKRQVPGHYIFHYGEECGGIGSGHLADDPSWYEGIKCAIALDRKGYSDVITHQIGRCASDAFAASLAAELNKDKCLLMDYEASDAGIFTDTANYVGIIGECTNLSVGYFHMHSTSESLDVEFLSRLLDALCNLDQSALVYEREPGVHDFNDWSSYDDTSCVNNWTWHNHTPKVPSTTPGMQYEYCFNCGVLFRLDESVAVRYARYCTRTCEDEATERQDRRLEYWRREANDEREKTGSLTPVETLTRLSSAKSIYLDEEYAEVQDALIGSIN